MNRVWYRQDREAALAALRRDEGAKLPPTLWAKLATVESGWWAHDGVEERVVPAAHGLDGGVWFAVRTGVRPLAVKDWSIGVVRDPFQRLSESRKGQFGRLFDCLPQLLEDRALLAGDDAPQSRPRQGH